MDGAAVLPTFRRRKENHLSMIFGNGLPASERDGTRGRGAYNRSERIRQFDKFGFLPGEKEAGSLE